MEVADVPIETTVQAEAGIVSLCLALVGTGIPTPIVEVLFETPLLTATLVQPLAGVQLETPAHTPTQVVVLAVDEVVADARALLKIAVGKEVVKLTDVLTKLLAGTVVGTLYEVVTWPDAHAPGQPLVV